ncbi:restriction endonuclease subunit S [Burkholderia sp. AU15512]|uniref:restriction endonuclease subunit S n=1 Tax=Burkholderia sp. AU15512 TaxID=2015345 RepID=UPI000B7A0C77|nr:restriction endonuclease subunit S [Burkholderia sp. AU15512]OXI22523.1 type I restriction endonuclease subunit S [Burkholderia sp. AU15512]
MSLPTYPEYKDSQLSWLGKVPTHWDVGRLKLSVSLATDKTDRRWNPIALENIESWSGKFVPTETKFVGEGVAFEPGDILFGKLRPYLAKAYLADCSGEAVGDFHVLRPSERLVPRFLQYQVLSQEFIAMVDGSTFGSKMPRVNWEFLSNMILAIPPSDEQRTIAGFLDRETRKIDALIAEQEKLLVLLAEKRQATISHAVTRGLNSDAPMKDSGVAWLGNVPVHWRVVPLKRLLADVKAGPFGSALTKEMYVSSGYRVYGQEQVIPADFSIGDYYIDDSKYAELQQYSVKAGDILISCVGTFGKIAIVPENVERGIINPRLIRVRVGASLSGRYLEAVLRSSVVFEQFSMVSRGGTMDVINIGTLNAVTLAVPPMCEQEDLLAFLDEETSKLDQLKSEAGRAIDLLKERRSALISAAVTGKIDVRNAVQQELAA